MLVGSPVIATTKKEIKKKKKKPPENWRMVRLTCITCAAACLYVALQAALRVLAGPVKYATEFYTVCVV